jgi:anti-sigma regulatory factor (Ser/Thr protein kinase)
MKDQAFEAEIPAEIGAAEDLYARLRAWLLRLGDPSARFAVELLCREIYANTIEHGGLAAADHIRIRMVIQGEILSCRIQHEGAGFAPPNVRGLVGELHEARGRGLAIIAHYADHLYFEEGGRVISFDKRISGGTNI